MNRKYRFTMYACFTGYIVQAIVNNFVPLLFLTFQRTYNISIQKITFLVTFNFLLQLFIDLISAGIIRKLGYRASIVFAHFSAAAGLLLLPVLPELLPDPFFGLLICVAVYAVGGGLIEVLISPVVEACPNERKEAMMSLLHSFYCWGHMAVVLLSTLFFVLFGIENWKLLAVMLALVPFLNGFVFIKVPICKLLREGDNGMTLRQLFSSRLFYILLLLMICAGGSELAVSQWTSALAEKGLHLNKTVGDLLGTTMFAGMMGLARALYAKLDQSLNLKKAMTFSALLCLFSYLLIAMSPIPFLGLAGCGICGFSVGLFWPGTYSIAAKKMKRGGTTMFAFLALAGDFGCSAGPTMVGFMSGVFGENLRIGILTAIILPVFMLVGLLLLKKEEKNGDKESQGLS